MYRRPALVECAACRERIPIEKADVVEFGTGYRCFRCSTTAQVMQHLEEAARQERERDSDDWPAPGPDKSVAEVTAEVMRNLSKRRTNE